MSTIRPVFPRSSRYLAAASNSTGSFAPLLPHTAILTALARMSHARVREAGTRDREPPRIHAVSPSDFVRIGTRAVTSRRSVADRRPHCRLDSR